MNTGALFLDKSVWCAEIHLEAGGQGDRAQRAVKGDRHVERFRHCADLPGFQDSAAVAHVRLQDVHSAPRQHVFESPPGKITLTGGNRRMACPGKLQEFILVLAQDRFLNKHQMIRLQQVNQLFGHRLMDPSVKIHSDSHTGYRFLNRRHPFHCRVQFVIGVDPPQLVCSVHLDGLVSLCRRFLCRLSGVPRMIAADPAVNLYAVPAFPAEQIINRYAQGLSLDVPHCLLNAGNGACQNRTAPVKPSPVHLLESVFDIRCAMTDQLRAQFLHGSCHTVRLSLADRFTPADQAVVRCHFQKQPSRGNLEKLQLCNFHVLFSSVTVCLIT